MSLAYRAQVTEFQRLAIDIFRASNHDIKALIEAVILGPYYRAADTTETDPVVLEALRFRESWNRESAYARTTSFPH